MTEARLALSRTFAAALILAGLGAALLPALWPVGLVALVGPWLAQPALALGMAMLWPAPESPARRLWWRDAVSVGVLWGATFGLLGLALVWPYTGLLQTGSLSSALGLGAVIGLAWTVLWRQWTLFSFAGRRGGGLAALASAVPGTWSVGRGLVLAAAVLAAAIGGWLLVWPPPHLDSVWWLAVPYAVGLLAVHGLLQRFGAAPEAPPVIEPPLAQSPLFDAPQGDDEAELAGGDLYAHARSGQIDAAIAVLEAGGDPDALPEPGASDQRSLPMLAALLPDLRLLRALIGRGVDLNQQHAGLTPLLAATRDSWHGRIDAVTTLLANGADPRLADRDGNTPLHHAARSTDPAIAAQLLDAGAELLALNAEAQPPLALALASSNWRVARFLLERGAKPELPGAQPVLLAAAAGDDDDPAGVQLLLKHKAKVDARDAHGRTALLEAIAAGHPQIAQTLIDAGASVDAADDEGRTAFLEAAAAPNSALLEAVLAKSPNPHAQDLAGRNALALACDAGADPERLRALLALGIDRDVRDAAGRRPVDHAVGGGRWPLVAVLDPDYPLPADVAGVDVETALTPPRERLHEALRQRDFAAAAAVIAEPEPPSRVALSMLLLEFAEPAGIDAFEWLLDAGAHVDDRVSAMDSVGLLLLDRGLDAELGLRSVLSRGQTPQGAGALGRWLQATQKEAWRAAPIALLLLERGVDPFAAAPGGDTCLGLASQAPSLPVLDALLARGLDPAQRDARGATPLHHAVNRGHESAIKRLIRHGASADSRAADGQTPHGAALARGRRDLAEWLDWGPWKLPGRALQPGDLPAAAMAGDLGAVVRLIGLGLPADSLDTQGCTALLRAAGGGHLALVDHLLGLGADHGLSARTGATPLSAAISMRHGPVVDRLLAAGADPELPMPGGVTPLMLAAALGLPDLVSRLLRAGAAVSAQDAQGLTPLHCAALFAFTSRERSRVLALFDTLLLADADADAVSTAEQTPTLLLLGARAEAGASVDEEVLLAALDRLLSEGVGLAHVEHRGLTALHLAALHGLGRSVERLLREGADPSARDRLGRTPPDLALIRGFVDIAALFQPGRIQALEREARASEPANAPPPAAPPATGMLPSLARLLKPRDP